ncbi:MAG: hypothetical protein AMXMBFR12_01490 [Candidatus Babeliales bacterium]
MKSIFKMFALVALISGSLLHGYAIVYDKDSPVPKVDIYVYNVGSAEKAAKKHAAYGKALGVPAIVIKGLESAKGPIAALGAAAAAPTGGVSAGLGAGYGAVVSVLKVGMDLFSKPIQKAIAEVFRGEDHAFHENVWRGNRGRKAEWKTGRNMYVIVTMPNNLLPLNEPIEVKSGRTTGFTLVPTGDARAPYKAQFENDKERVGLIPISTQQYISAEEDKRDLKLSKDLAKTSGQHAFWGSTQAPAKPQGTSNPRIGFALPE